MTKTHYDGGSIAAAMALLRAAGIDFEVLTPDIEADMADLDTAA